MFGTHFYHERIKKSVAIFGKLFNNIYIIRKDATDQVTSQVKVPLAYAPKRKYLERITEMPNLMDDTKVAIKLPRMSFEITNLAYDPERQLVKTNTIRSNVGSRPNVLYSPVPYTINFQLNIYAKTQDDALQIVEQIFPFFSPYYTVTVTPFPVNHPELKEDIPVVLQGVSFSDDYEGEVETRRTIIYQLDFEMKLNFYGPDNTNGKIIRKAEIDLYNIGADSDTFTEKLELTPNPIDTFGFEDSDFTFNLTISDTQ